VVEGSIREVVLLGLPLEQERRLLRDAANYLAQQFRFKVLPRPLRDLPDLRIDLATWSHPSASLRSFDRLVQSVQARGDFCLVLTARDWLGGALSAAELLNRYQRLLPLPAGRARALDLDRILEAQATLEGAVEAAHDPGLAEDTWRWAVRLCCELEPGALAGTSLLQDAHDLAFFSSGSVEYLEQFGVPSTYAKVRRCLSRMSPQAICQALVTRQPPLVSQMMETALRGGEWPSQSMIAVEAAGW